MNKILLVEDNEVNREMIARRLSKKEYLVVEAPDGETAVRCAMSEKPDIILMDMNLPVLSGADATRLIRGTPSISAIPIIAVTAHAMSDDAEFALRSGCNDVVTKPIDFPHLLAIIDLLISRNRCD